MTIEMASNTDAELKTRVEAELNGEPSLNFNEIGVIVKDGVVTLIGGWIRTRNGSPRNKRRTGCEG